MGKRTVEALRLDERNRIILWLLKHNPDIQLIGELPKWRGTLWAFLHPERFAVAVALARLGNALFRDEHIERGAGNG